MSQVCEAFGCTPTVALREMTDGPENLWREILELRAYAAAKDYVDRTKADEIKATYWTDMVFDVVAEMIRRRMAGRGSK